MTPDTTTTPANEPSGSTGKANLQEIRDAIHSIWSEYTGLTRGATFALLVVSFLSITKELDCVTAPACIPAAWMSALTSDGMLTIWTLIIALCVGVHLKIRQERGLLDGADHYSIGRALAYGYFSNFLIGALLLIKKKSDDLKLKGNDRLKLRVIFPSTLQELDRFRKTLEQQLQTKTKNQAIDDVYGSAIQTLRRNVLVLTTAASDTQAARDFYLDFPTTLYTVQDYFETWNIWLEENNKPPISLVKIERLQQKQIDDFFKHLEDLSQSDVGVKAVESLGVKLSKQQLSELYNSHFEKITTTEISVQLKQLAAQTP